MPLNMRASSEALHNSKHLELYQEYDAKSNIIESSTPNLQTIIQVTLSRMGLQPLWYSLIWMNLEGSKS